jgi:hypothetical protein
MRGTDWCVERVGRKWRLAPCFIGYPLFKTRKAALEAVYRQVKEDAISYER